MAPLLRCSVEWCLLTMASWWCGLEGRTLLPEGRLCPHCSVNSGTNRSPSKHCSVPPRRYLLSCLSHGIIMTTSEMLKCHTNIRLRYKLPWCSTILANDTPAGVSGRAGSEYLLPPQLSPGPDFYKPT